MTRYERVQKILAEIEALRPPRLFNKWKELSHEDTFRIVWEIWGLAKDCSRDVQWLEEKLERLKVIFIKEFKGEEAK